MRFKSSTCLSRFFGAFGACAIFTWWGWDGPMHSAARAYFPAAGEDSAVSHVSSYAH